MDVKQVVVSAWEAVQAAALPEHVQGVALEQAIRLFAEEFAAGGHADVGRSSKKRPAGDRSPVTDKSDDSDSNDFDEESYFLKFSDESGIPVEKLQGVYLADGIAGVKIGLARRRLGDTEAEKNRNIATLVVGARWYAEGKATVTISEVREAAKSLGHEPSRNLSKQLESVPGTLAIGNGNDRAVRVQGSKFDDPFRELVDKVVSA